MEKKTLGFIGGGRITKIFLKAFANKGIEFDGITVFDPDTNALDALKSRFPNIAAEGGSVEKAAASDLVFLAVHPPVVMESLSKIKPYLRKDSTVVSLAPKITMARIEAELDGFGNIARVNPSAPGIINQGMNPVAYSGAMNEERKKELAAILGILGEAPVVDESRIEAYAVICAMGSTYFWFQLQMLQELAVSFGMEEAEAKETLSKMMAGTINTLFYSGLPENEVMDLVPVKPLGEFEASIRTYYSDKLNMIYEKIRP